MRKPTKKAPTKFKFYSEKDFNRDLRYSREFSTADAIAKIILYRINTVKTKSHKLYGESKVFQKEFLKPIELSVTMVVDDPTTKFMASNGIFNERIDLIKFGVYKEELDEKDCHINRGDFFIYFDGDKERKFEITKISNVESNNSTLGYKPFFTLIEGTQALDDVFMV